MTTRCFYSLGIGPRDTTYLAPDGSSASKPMPFVLPALLGADWALAHPAEVTFHALVTPELKRPITHSESAYRGQSPREVLASYIDPSLHPAVFRTWEMPEYDVTDRDLWKMIHLVLSKVEGGDHVVVELTHGMRHVNTALLLAAGLVRAMRPDVTLGAVTYAELGARSQIFDIRPLLDLFLWANAAGALGRLDVQPLAELATAQRKSLGRARHEGRLDIDVAPLARAAVALHRLGPSLALGWPREIAEVITDLQHAVAGLNTLEVASALGEGTAALHAVGLVADQFRTLGATSLTPDTLDASRLAFDLALIERLRDAGRHGDALRLLREWIVNLDLVAHDQAGSWLELEARRASEARLHAQTGRGRGPATPLGREWAAVSAMRNAVSHGKLSHGHHTTPSSIAKKLQEAPATLRAFMADPSSVRFTETSGSLWLANAFSLGMIGSDITAARLVIEEVALADVKQMPWRSCVGHVDTATVLSELLGREVPYNRASVEIAPGDEVIVAQLLGPRLPEGATQLPEGARFRWYKIGFTS